MACQHESNVWGGHNLYNVRSSIGTGSLLSDPGRGDPGEALTR